MPIRSFRDPLTRAIFDGLKPKGIAPDVRSRTKRKLEQLDAAVVLDDLRNPPGNRLEALAGGRAGQHSIRVNRQWRICFTWSDGGADDVEFVDYH